MKRLRIFVPSASELLSDDGRYGEGLIAWKLFSELARRGHDLVVCTREASISTTAPFELIVTGPASRFESVEPLAYGRRVARICRELGGARRFDLVHWLFPANREELLFAPPAGMRYVIGPKGASWPAGIAARPTRPGDVVRAGLRPAFRRANARALDAATICLGGTEEAARDFPRDRFRVVAFGADADEFTPTPLAGAPRILFVGRLYREKGVLELVEAFARVRASKTDAKLDIAGEGELRSLLEQRVRELGLEAAVTFHGHVAHERLPELFREAALLCLPTHWDAFGMVVVEAMAAGRAVVASDVGGPRVLVTPEGGRLVPVDDVDALAGALTDLLGDPDLLARMGAHNRRRFEDEFTLKRFVDGVERAYADALETA